MKRFKKFFINLMAMLMLCVGVVGFSACKEDIVSVEIKISAYNVAESSMYSEDLTFTVDLYRHFAPKTVDKIVEYINSEDKIYENAVFYMNTSKDSQIMMGDLKFDGENISQTVLPEIEGEFELNGTIGSNLVNAEGVVGLWRGCYESDDSYKTSSDARNSGRATWYMPIIASSSLDGNLCLFGKYDLTNSDNVTTLAALKAVLGSENCYSKYVIFYTGTYDEQNATENYGLTFNFVTLEDWTDNYDETENTYNDIPVFEAEGNQLETYNYYTIKMPNIDRATGKSYAGITSIKIK